MSDRSVVMIGPGVFSVTIDGRTEIVHAAVSPDASWAFCRGDVFRWPRALPAQPRQAPGARPVGAAVLLPVTAPMPATVRQVLVSVGSSVTKGETLLILEAMKMELPLRASGDGTVTAVHCREGELVQPDTVLVELS